jgi:methyl-accepting chemotaxis protein
MDQVTQQNAAMVEQATAAAANLRNEAGVLPIWSPVRYWRWPRAHPQARARTAGHHPAGAPVGHARRAWPQLRPGSSAAVAPRWEEF